MIGSRVVDSTLYPGAKREAFNVRHTIDNAIQEFEEEELRPLITLPDAEKRERKKIVDQLASVVAFDYLESRITGMCETSQYSCAHMYAVCKTARAFNPAYASLSLTAGHIDDVVATIQPLSEHVDVNLLKRQKPCYTWHLLRT